MTITQRLYGLLKEKGVQQKALAEYLQIPASTLNTWLGRGEDFPAQYVIPTCKMLNIAPEYLLSGEEKFLPVVPDGYVQLNSNERFLFNTVRLLDEEGLHVVINSAIEEARRVRAGGGSANGADSVG